MAGSFLDYIAIKNTLSLYCVALDTKDFDLLNEVFTPNVEAKYPFPGGEMKGVKAVADAISQRYIPLGEFLGCRRTLLTTSWRLEPISSQHALTTQNINFYPNGKSCSVMTYFTGIHFGKGRWQGHQVTAYGKYIDELVRVGNGQWRIAKREVKFMGRIGEERVMEPSYEMATS